MLFIVTVSIYLKWTVNVMVKCELNWHEEVKVTVDKDTWIYTQQIRLMAVIDKPQMKSPLRHSVAQWGAVKSHSSVQLKHSHWGMSLWAAISFYKKKKASLDLKCFKTLTEAAAALLLTK